MSENIWRRTPGSNKNPLSFGDDQTIVDLDKVVWEPLEVDGLAPGAEIAAIRSQVAEQAALRERP